MDDKLKRNEVKTDSEKPSVSRFAISILEAYVVFAIVAFLCALLLPAAETAREMQGLPPTLPFNVTEWDRWIYVSVLVGLTLITPIPFCLALLGVRRILPSHWKRYIIRRSELPSRPSQDPTPRERRIFIAVACVLGLITFLVLIYEETLYNPWPIPMPVKEQNRVEHPAGFSFIFPEGWKTIVIPSNPEHPIGGVPNSLITDPTTWRTRPTPHWSVRLCEVPPPTEEYTPVTFQGRNAFEQFNSGGGANTVYLYYALLFEREERWFEVIIEIPNGTFLGRERIVTRPREIEEYVATFRIQEDLSSRDDLK